MLVYFQNSAQGKGGGRNPRVPPSVDVRVVGVRMSSIEVSKEKLNFAMTVDHKEVHTGGTFLSKAKG